MIKSKQNKVHSKLIASFQQQFGVEPPIHILSIFTKSTAFIESQKLTINDLTYIKHILTLKLSGLVLQCNNEEIDRQLLHFVIKKVKFSESGLHELSIINCSFLNSFSQQLSVALAKCKTLKQIRLINCSIKDSTFANIMHPLQTNNNLRSLDLSNNKITTCLPLIQVLEEHEQYRSEKMELLKMDYQQICEEEVMEINLQNNQIEDEEAMNLAGYIRVDRWVRSINLSGNKISKQGLENFIQKIQNNNNLLNVDLRNNIGSTIEISNSIFNKMLKNMAEYKLKRSKMTKRQNNSADFGYKKSNSRNLTMNQQNYLQEHLSCENCKKLCSKILQTEKKVIDLQLEIVKLKKILQNRGFQISVINPSTPTHQTTEQISFSAKNMTGGDSSSDDIVQKIEHMMAELTKIFEAHEIHHHTQTDITNPLWTTHNLSNTVQILANNQNSIVVPLPEEEDELSDIQS